METTEIKSVNSEKDARRAYFFVGLGVVVFWLVTNIVRRLITLFIIPDVTVATGSWLWALTTMVPMYAVGFPAGYLVIRFARKDKIEENKFGARFAVTPFIAIFLGLSGSIIGLIINAIIMSAAGLSSESMVQDVLLTGNPIAMFLFSVILAPIFEELLFRKLIIDRTHIYGGALSVVVSAAMFGLFHGNIQQMIMAAAIGLLFGYIYLKTGKIRYTIILHMIVNALGNIMSLLARDLLPVLSDPEPEAYMSLIPQLLGLIAYELFYFGIGTAGLVLFIIFVRKVSVPKEPQTLPCGVAAKTVLLNVGMILFVLMCAYMVASSMVPGGLPFFF